MTLRKFFGNLSIRNKLFIYAGILTASMLVFGLFAVSQANVIQGRQIPARSAVREMQVTLLTLRVQEQLFIKEVDSPHSDFYRTRKSAHVDAWERNCQIFDANRRQLMDVYKGTELEAKLASIEPQMTRYRELFHQLIEAYWQRGYGSFGREGALETRGQMLEARLSNRPTAEVAFLQLKATQYDFLLHKEISLVASFNERRAALEAQLATNEDRDILTEYAQLFSDVVALHEKIGLAPGDGLQGALDQLAEEMTPKVEDTEAAVLTATSEGISAILRSITLATVILSIISIGTAVFIARFIVRRIQLVADASHRVIKGDLHYRLPIYGHDELGRLSELFNIMVERLEKNRQTLRRRAHELEVSVRRFELVSRAVNEAIYEWDIVSNKFTWGDGLMSVFGYHPKDREASVEWWVGHIHPEDTQAIDASLSQHLQRRSSNWKKEYRFKRANGSYAYCQDRGFIEYENDKPVRMVGSIVDVTRQKELERTKNEFISIASHQLRTPLGSIRWNLELLLEKLDTLPKEEGELAQEAYNSTKRMGGLVNDLLSVARIEQGRVQDIPEKTDLVEILRAAIVEIQPLAKQKQVHVNDEGLKHGKAELVIDPKRFREVIQNLLSNAVKYTPSKGNVRVDIAAKSDSFIVSIADTGIGIPPEDQSKLFTKFYRAANVTRTDTEGSGLGLFVVKAYVKDWGGRIWFTSEVNQGTTFYISIPRKPRHKSKGQL